MDNTKRSGLAVGAILILAGLALLVAQLVPAFRIGFSWPLIVIAVGVLQLLVGLLSVESGMLVPGSIVTGVGGLLYWQNATGRWDSWSYAWALIPGFVGLGTLLYGLRRGKRDDIRGGAWMVFISLILFALFGSFFGALGFLGRYWPVLLILLGVVLLFQTLFRRE